MFGVPEDSGTFRNPISIREDLSRGLSLSAARSVNASAHIDIENTDGLAPGQAYTTHHFGVVTHAGLRIKAAIVFLHVTNVVDHHKEPTGSQASGASQYEDKARFHLCSDDTPASQIEHQLSP